LGSREYGRRLEEAKVNLAEKLMLLEGKGL
jgi:hypothetical protein